MPIAESLVHKPSNRSTISGSPSACSISQSLMSAMSVESAMRPVLCCPPGSGSALEPGAPDDRARTPVLRLVLDQLQGIVVPARLMMKDDQPADPGRLAEPHALLPCRMAVAAPDLELGVGKRAVVDHDVGG